MLGCAFKVHHERPRLAVAITSPTPDFLKHLSPCFGEVVVEDNAVQDRRLMEWAVNLV